MLGMQNESDEKEFGNEDAYHRGMQLITSNTRKQKKRRVKVSSRDCKCKLRNESRRTRLSGFLRSRYLDDLFG